MNAYLLRTLREVSAGALLAAIASTASAQNQAPSAAAGDDESETIVLSPFEVDSSQDVGYKATNAISGTRTNVPISEIPMNIQVVTSELLDDLAVSSPTQALKYFGSVGTSDVGPSSRFGAGIDLDSSEQLFGTVRLRGLTVSEGLRDGIRTYSQIPSDFVDRVELVRGPAAVLYGLSEPTGLYNTITKSPVLGRNFGEIRASVGNYSNYGGFVDVNRTLGDSVAIRVLASAHHFDSEFLFNEGTAYYLMPEVSWRIAPQTTLKVEYTYGESRRAFPDQRYSYGVGVTTPNYPTSVPGMIIPIYEDSRYDVDPRYSWAGNDAWTEIHDRNLLVTLTQDIGQDFSINLQANSYSKPFHRQNANIALIAGDNAYFWTDQPEPKDSYILRRFQDDFSTQTVDAWDATAVYKHEFDLPLVGRSTQSITFGATGYREKTGKEVSTLQTDHRARDADGNVIVASDIPDYVTNELLRENFPTLNGGLWDGNSYRPSPGVWFDYVPIDAPLASLDRNGAVLTLLPPGVGGFNNFTGAAKTDSKYTSIWASWTGKFADDRVILTGGVFRTTIDQKSGTTLDDLTPFYDKSATMPQLGVIARPLDGDWGSVSFFALYSESLRPNTSQRDAYNNLFDPRFGKGREYGVKFDLWQNRISGTVSMWDIDQTNRVIYDENAPNPNNASGLGANIARGLNTSKGWEADIFFAWTKGLQSMFSYSHGTVKTGGELNPADNGAEEFGSYHDGFGMVTSYRFANGALRGLSVGLGINYTSPSIATGRESFNDNKQRTIPAVWDGNLFAGYRTTISERHVRFQINVTNLFKKDMPVGWDPSHLSAAGTANRPFLYSTERKFMFTTAVEF